MNPNDEPRGIYSIYIWHMPKNMSGLVLASTLGSAEAWNLRSKVTRHFGNNFYLLLKREINRGVFRRNESEGSY